MPFDEGELENILSDAEKKTNSLTDQLQGVWFDMSRDSGWGEREVPYKLSDDERTQLADAWIDKLKGYIKAETGLGEEQIDKRLDGYMRMFFGIDAQGIRDFAEKTPIMDKNVMLQQTQRWGQQDLQVQAQSYISKNVTDDNFEDVKDIYVNKVGGEDKIGNVPDASALRNFVTNYTINEFANRYRNARDYSAR